MTSDDLERPFCILFHRPTVSAAKMQPNDSSFWQYAVYGDISGGSLERGCQTTVGLSKTLIFSPFGRYIFGSLGNKTNIIA